MLNLKSSNNTTAVIRKSNFKLNWKYALGELALIFLGISLAIGFNNWNDNRKKGALEKELLKQIYLDVLTNRGDIIGDYEQLKFGMQSHLSIEKYMRDDTPYVDSMCFDFYWLKQDEYAFPVTGGYENLKSQGLDLIKNDSILELIQYTYEFGYPRISRETPFYPDLDQYFTEFYQQHFTVNDDTSLVFSKSNEAVSVRFPFNSRMENVRYTVVVGYIPKDFEGLKRSDEFKVMLRQSMNYRRYKIRQYLNVKELSDMLMKTIELELGMDYLRDEEK